MYNSKSIYIHCRHNTIKHLFLTKIISDFVKSKEIIANPLTKDLSRELVYNSSRGISLKFLKDERV